MPVCCDCYVLSGRGFCNELITRPEESYRLWRVIVCDLETSRMRRSWPALGRSVTKKIKDIYSHIWNNVIATDATKQEHINKSCYSTCK